MMKRLLALALAGTLVAPQIGMATESAFNNDRAAPAMSKFPDKLPLPPIPYLETMPWIGFGSKVRGPDIDTLLLRDLNAPAIGKASAFADNGSRAAWWARIAAE